MNNELMETIINGMLKDIRDLKDEVKTLKTNPSKKNFNRDPKKPATENQLIKVEEMGGKVWAGMTSQDISDQFQEIFNRRNEAENQQEQPSIQTGADLDSEKGDDKQ